MKSYNMHVKTVIRNDHQKILLLKEKRADKKIRWDLPGSKFTEEQSFDEIVINNVQKVIGYYVYPGKIIGISNYIENEQTDVYVIMDASILNGELLLSKDYENYAWVDLERIQSYPLKPWLKEYIHETKYPFEDIEEQIEENETKSFGRRRSSKGIDFRSSIGHSRKQGSSTRKHKSSFGILKDTIKRTFHPKEANVTQTTPKENEIYQNASEESKHKVKKDIIIDHGNTQDIIIDHDSPDDIIIDHSDDIIIEDIPSKSSTKLDSSTNKPSKASNKGKKVFDMNINKEENMQKIKKVKNIVKKEPEIKIIHEGEKTPRIRKEKASTEKISFSSERGKRYGWKEKLNDFNRTDANNRKKRVPTPKGRRR